MIEVSESAGMGAGGMPPAPAAGQRKRLVYDDAHNHNKDGMPAAAEADGNTATLSVEAARRDEATAAVKETRLAFFAARDAGAANRIEQGELLLKAQAQLARYGTGTFTAMLLAPRPEGFGFKSATSAYELMAEAEGKPKRSHKTPQSTGVSTPGRLNEKPEFLPINLDGALSPADPLVGIPDDQPANLDTSHTHSYVPFRCKGIYVPKSEAEGFTTWLQALSNAALSDRFFAWYQAENPSRQQEESNETTTPIQ